MRHVFLIGLSGSGKSTVGRLLAERLERPLFDIDALIEAQYGESIPTIFARYGEVYFRDCEQRVLANIAQQQEGAVIVTGGGIVLRAENRLLMAEHGIRVFLQVAPERSLQRLQEQYQHALTIGANPELRPLLAGPDPLATLQQHLLVREPWYREAEFTCSTHERSAEQVAEEIATMVRTTEMSEHADEVVPIVRHIHAGNGYDAIVAWQGLRELGEYVKRLNLPSRIFLVTDENIERIHGSIALESLRRAGFEPLLYSIPAGESSKSQQQVNALYDWLLEHHAERREAIIALGGGVVGDLVGFVAATYLRGVPLIQVPTSLLAQVDSSIGGKTGINHPRGKNLIGAFYHPLLVLADPAVLFSLPERSRTEGWAEIVKCGIILDAELFALLEQHANALREFSGVSIAVLCRIIARCIDLKASVIEGDEKEQGRRAILNYGHTVGHALENVAGYGQWLHGEAVSLGMVVAATMAQKAGMFAQEDVERQHRLLVALGLPVECKGTVRAQQILDAMQLDKKVAGKKIRWIMPTRIGEVVITPMADEIVNEVVTAFFAEGAV